MANLYTTRFYIGSADTKEKELRIVRKCLRELTSFDNDVKNPDYSKVEGCKTTLDYLVAEAKEMINNGQSLESAIQTVIKEWIDIENGYYTDYNIIYAYNCKRKPFFLLNVIDGDY